MKGPEVTKVGFALIKVNIKEKYLVLTPNIMRFLALKLINNDQTLIVKLGNIVALSNNQARLFSRTVGSAIIGFLGVLFTTLPYCILMLLLYFNATENCDYKCSDYFEQLPRKGPVRIYNEESTGYLLVGRNDNTRKIEIYIPSKTANEVTVNSNGKLKTTKTDSKVRKKAKEAKFSDF